MSKEFNPGDPVFTNDGQSVTFIARVSDGYCVRPVYEDPDMGPQEDGPPFIVGQIYSEPPVAHRNQQILELDAKLKAKREELNDLQVAVRVTETQINNRKAVIKRHKSLERLEDFLEGRITHFVFHEYGAPRIREFKEAIEATDEDRYAKVPPLKLLTLFGKVGGELNWRLDKYSDGSGGSRYLVFPCCSLEEAQAKAKEILADMCEEARKCGRGLSGYDECAKLAAEIGFEIPSDIRAIHIKHSLANALANLQKAELEANGYRSIIESMQALIANSPE